MATERKPNSDPVQEPVGTELIDQEVHFWFEVRRDSTSRIEALSQLQIDFSPRAEVWSIGEVVDHILRAEAFYRLEFQEFIAKAHAGKPTVINRSFDEVDIGIALLPKSIMPILGIPFMLMNPFVPQPIRNTIIRSRLLRAKHPRVLNPEKGRRREALLEDLSASFRKTQSVFDENPGLDYSRMLHKHPMIGVNTAPQLVRIAALHEQRHQEQMGHVMELPGFPRARDPILRSRPL